MSPCFLTLAESVPQTEIELMRILMPLKPHSLMVLLLFEKISPRSNCIIGNDWSTIINGKEFLWSLRNLLFSQKDHLMLTGKILWRTFFFFSIKGSEKESWEDLTLGCIQERNLGCRDGNCLLQGKKKKSVFKGQETICSSRAKASESS